MYNSELKSEIHVTFQELSMKSKKIVEESKTSKMAVERISAIVSSRIAAESEGYIVDMYTSLVAKIKEEDYFRNPEHLNAFYRLNLRDRLNEQYHFEIELLDTYRKGIDYEEVSQLYTAAGMVAGTLAIGGILKFVLSSLINIPITVIIAGAVIAGLMAYFAVPGKNKRKFIRAVDKFLNDMENEILDWLTEIEDYLNSQIRALYKK